MGTDEWNQVKSAGNYGWPYFLGTNVPYARYDFATGQSGDFQNPSAPQNRSPNNTGITNLPPARPAWIWYPSGASAAFRELNPDSARTAMAGPVYQYRAELNSHRKLPAYYNGSLFIYEWSRNFIKEVKLDENGDLLAILPFLPSFKFKRPIEMEMGPDGAIYMIEWGTGFSGKNPDARILRIDYITGNRAPIAEIQSSSTSGSTPLGISFSGENSRDPDGDTLSYAWSFRNDGTIDSREARPEYTYAVAGNYLARLTVTDPSGSSGVAEVHVTAGNHAPEVTLLNPPNGSFFDWGERVGFEVVATDFEDGGIACEQIRMEPLLGHNDHAHGLGEFFGCFGVINTPDTEDADTDRLVLVLRATTVDRGHPPANPLQGTTTHILNPRIKQAEHFAQVSQMVIRPTLDPWGGGSDLVSDTTTASQAYFTFNPVHLRAVASMTLRIRSTTRFGSIEIREGSVDGHWVGGTNFVSKPDAYQDLTLPVNGSDLSSELYLIARSSPSDPGELRLNWVRFNSRGTASSPYLQVAESPEGPYEKLGSAHWNNDQIRFSLDRPSRTAFFQVVAGKSLKIRSIETEGLKLKIYVSPP